MEACYIHVPFCNSICAYCDFVRCGYQKELANKWLQRIEVDIEKEMVKGLKTIYIGGGTPTALNDQQLTHLLSVIAPFTKDVKEYTMEANPDSLSISKMEILQKYQVNRISLGVQTFQTSLQDLIQRKHTLKEIKQLIEQLHLHGIYNISIDLMYGLPTQTIDMWKEDLAIALSLDIQHISLYALTIEEHSQFGREQMKNIDANVETDMYEYAIAYLTKHGYIHYEISNFAHRGYESLHNLAYWYYEDFIGIGCGASGKKEQNRYDNTHNLHTYIQQGAKPNYINLSKTDEMFETIMMGLRLKEGITITKFNERYQIDFLMKYNDAIQKNIEQAYLIVEQDRVKTTYQGMLMLNTVLLDFLSL